MNGIGNQGIPYDMTGLKFGRLTVIKRVPSTDDNSRWQCMCECGAVTETSRSPLVSGNSKSCGCLSKELALVRFTTHGQSSVHPNAQSRRTPEYNKWCSMLARCRNPKNRRFPRYGARGIQVCERWLRFENFFADMGTCPAGYTIERKDNDGNYEPSNCIWMPGHLQASNRSDTVRIEYNGETLIAKEWAQRLGIKPSSFLWRYHNWTLDKVMTTPLKR